MGVRTGRLGGPNGTGTLAELDLRDPTHAIPRTNGAKRVVEVKASKESRSDHVQHRICTFTHSTQYITHTPTSFPPFKLRPKEKRCVCLREMGIKHTSCAAPGEQKKRGKREKSHPTPCIRTRSVSSPASSLFVRVDRSRSPTPSDSPPCIVPRKA